MINIKQAELPQQQIVVLVNLAQKDNNRTIFDGKRMKHFNVLIAALELPVAIIGGNHIFGKITTGIWLLLEEKILVA